MLATVSDFIRFVGKQEAAELSRVDDPDINTVDKGHIQQGLDEAANVLLSSVTSDWGLFKTCQLRIARYLLDPYSGRENVKQGYLDSMELVANRSKKIYWE